MFTKKNRSLDGSFVGLWAFMVLIMVWWLACMTGVFFLCKALYDWLQRN